MPITNIDHLTRYRPAATLLVRILQAGNLFPQMQKKRFESGNVFQIENIRHINNVRAIFLEIFLQRIDTGQCSNDTRS